MDEDATANHNSHSVQLDPELEAAKALYRSGDEADAVPLFKKLAESGSAPAMTWVGYVYLKGKGVAVDTAAALEWFLKAAEADDAEAMGWIGNIYFRGSGVDVDKATAYQWYAKAADAGDASAMSWLGYMLSQGIGVPVNLDAARLWFSKSAELGDADGQYNYGSVLAAAGEHEESDRWLRKAAAQDHKPSIKWQHQREAHNLLTAKRYAEALPVFEKLAEEGDAWAHECLGYIYFCACGVAKNFGQAVRHYEAAYEGGRHAVANIAGVANFRAGRPEVALKWLRTETSKPISSLYWQFRVLDTNPQLERHAGECNELLLKAANAGHLFAQRALAMRMIKGRGNFGTRLQGLRMFFGIFPQVVRIAGSDQYDERLH
ncbi:SEL1-like repeat protein [Mesorhizobium sp. NZP2298]|uniref:SEL1-like repeat protein n=1 Tax=Mesorhizobium sp. NZP2298 TaxID=2483403 RepID=UPI00155255E6|nr:tetratricopeptide repeat protein [Mesorhizobium sp. NZP2298]QKC96011.1 sel1 repeat family protein [Mesorhizobium sp. NZP2298]